MAIFMLEYLSLAYRIGLDAVAWVRGHGRRLTPAQIVERRKKWQPQFEEWLFRHRREKLRQDVIIRDMKRLDQYPEVDEKSHGISAWFRMGLIDTYHRGIMVASAWHSLVRDEEDDGWRFPNHETGEAGQKKVLLVGYIRFEDVEEVNWEGDEIYGYPHIFCYFSHRRQPYEEVAFCEEHNNDDLWFYNKVETYTKVRVLSKKRGLKRLY